MSKYIIVWNESKTEGVIFRNETGDSGEDDARHAADECVINPCSTLADIFLDTYGEGESCSIQEIDIDIKHAIPSDEF